MSLVRLVIVTLLLVPVNSLTCYDCTAPDDYFCYPFIKCEVKKTECIYDDIYNPEAFITDPPVEFRYYVNIKVSQPQLIFSCSVAVA